jgi:hypothetical protein
MTSNWEVFWYWLQCKVFIVLHEDDKLFVLESSIYTVLVEFFSILPKRTSIKHRAHKPPTYSHCSLQKPGALSTEP